MIARRAALVALVATCSLAACANTIDPDVAADLERTEAERDAAVAGTEAVEPFRPEGTPAELLTGLLGEAVTLSEAIVENEGDNEILARVDAYWAAAEPAVSEANATLARDIERAVALMRNGVERRRPADADKAAINLRTLVAAFDA